MCLLENYKEAIRDLRRWGSGRTEGNGYKSAGISGRKKCWEMKQAEIEWTLRENHSGLGRGWGRTWNDGKWEKRKWEKNGVKSEL